MAYFNSIILLLCTIQVIHGQRVLRKRSFGSLFGGQSQQNSGLITDKELEDVQNDIFHEKMIQKGLRTTPRGDFNPRMFLDNEYNLDLNLLDAIDVSDDKIREKYPHAYEPAMANIINPIYQDRRMPYGFESSRVNSHGRSRYYNKCSCKCVVPKNEPQYEESDSESEGITTIMPNVVITSTKKPAPKKTPSKKQSVKKPVQKKTNATNSKSNKKNTTNSKSSSSSKKKQI